jgi:ribosomal protein L37AE/L43A
MTNKKGKFKCLECKKGSYFPTLEKDRKGLTFWKCDKCGDLAI